MLGCRNVDSVSSEACELQASIINPHQQQQQQTLNHSQPSVSSTQWTAATNAVTATHTTDTCTAQHHITDCQTYSPRWTQFCTFNHLSQIYSSDLLPDCTQLETSTQTDSTKLLNLKDVQWHFTSNSKTFKALFCFQGLSRSWKNGCFFLWISKKCGHPDNHLAH